MSFGLCPSMASIGRPDRYGVDCGVSNLSCRLKLSTRFCAKPAWLRWTERGLSNLSQVKCTPRNHPTVPMKTAGMSEEMIRRNLDSTAESSEKNTKSLTYKPTIIGRRDGVSDFLDGS